MSKMELSPIIRSFQEFCASQGVIINFVDEHGNPIEQRSNNEYGSKNGLSTDKTESPDASLGAAQNNSNACSSNTRK